MVTRDRLAPGRIVMTDVAWYHSGTDSLRYNHGRRGRRSTVWPSYGNGDTAPRTDLVGMHRLKGDGSAHWKGRRKFDVQSIFSPSAYSDPIFTETHTFDLPVYF